MNTILVVDDRPDARYALVRTLTGAGYDVRETATGRDALRLARFFPDLIVLDIALQDMDGFEVCRRLKMDAVTSAIPVVQKTAVFRDEEHRRRGLAAGADEYLTEPIEPQLLVETVRRLLVRRGN
ncbi:MAG TPA: response regulator [Methylomirabilota bacterium]|jgi:CheY-like chemotaxis protein